MNVLSLFDGISCGQVALKRARKKVNNYYASEIDKNAIKITQKNFPKTHQLGDVTNWRSWNLPKIDLLMGGSPCQGFSNAGKGLNFNDPRSKLFFEFVKILKHYKPKYFLLENVRMKQEWQDIITDKMGVEPIMINSALVSAQNRVRLYWTNIPVTLPEDSGLSLSEVIGINAIGCASRARHIKGNSGKTEQRIEERRDNKANCMTTVSKNCLLKMGGVVRPLFRHEAELLQTIPVGYTDVISAHKALKAIGNAWSVDIITLILKEVK